MFDLVSPKGAEPRRTPTVLSDGNYPNEGLMAANIADISSTMMFGWIRKY